MAKKNFIPLCMMPFIANMMGEKSEEGGVEPEPTGPYTFKKHDLFWTFVFEEEGGGAEMSLYATDSLAPSADLLAAVNARRNIIFPADFDDTYCYPEGVSDDNELDTYMDDLLAQMKVDNPAISGAIRDDGVGKYTSGGKTLFSKVKARGAEVVFENKPDSPRHYRLEGEEQWGALWRDVEAEGYGNQSLYLTYSDK